MGAGLQQNMGKEWGPTVWSKMTESSPNPVFTDAAERSAKKVVGSSLLINIHNIKPSVIM